MSRLHSIGTAVLVALPLVAVAGDIVIRPPAGDGFVVKDDTGVTERLRVAEASGDISRNGVLFLHTRGVESTFLGDNAGTSNNSLWATGIGANALRDNVSGSANTAVGAAALRDNTTGYSNAAFGTSALIANNGVENTALGSLSMVRNTSGNRNVAVGQLSLWANTTGSDNVAVGDRALTASTTGVANTAVGSSALSSNQVGSGNTAIGWNALATSAGTSSSNVAVGSFSLDEATASFFNTAVGSTSLGALVSGIENTVVGASAHRFTTSGSFNTSLGNITLRSLDSGNDNVSVMAFPDLTSGSGNVGIGSSSGFGLVSVDNTVYIKAIGVPFDVDDVIEIGTIASEAFLGGVWGNTVSGGSPVVVNSADDFGLATSSRRFKRDIARIGENTPIQSLRPVSFRYRDEHVGEGEAALEYGLIAEEVAEVAPELVVLDSEGAPQSVRYHLLAPLLVAEVQTHERTIDDQEARVDSLFRRLEKLEAARRGDAALEVTR